MDVLTGLLAILIIGIIIILIPDKYQDEITVVFFVSIWFSGFIFVLYYIAKFLGHLILTWLQ